MYKCITNQYLNELAALDNTNQLLGIFSYPNASKHIIVKFMGTLFNKKAIKRDIKKGT